MKILERKDLSNWKYILVCSDCESKLEVEKDDVRAQHHEAINDCRPGESQPAYFSYHCQCPVCQKVLDVPRTVVPKAMETMLQKKCATVRGNYFDR